MNWWERAAVVCAWVVGLAPWVGMAAIAVTNV